MVVEVVEEVVHSDRHVLPQRSLTTISYVTVCGKPPNGDSIKTVLVPICMPLPCLGGHGGYKSVSQSQSGGGGGHSPQPVWQPFSSSVPSGEEPSAHSGAGTSNSGHSHGPQPTTQSKPSDRSSPSFSGIALVPSGHSGASGSGGQVGGGGSVGGGVVLQGP